MPLENKSGDQYSPNFQDLISLREAARISGLTPAHLRRLAGDKELWAKKIGKVWLTTEQAVLDYLARGRRPGPKSKT